MWKWFRRLLFIAVISVLGYATYDSYRGGFFNLPEISDTSYPISFKSGLRAILVDPEVSHPSPNTRPFFRRLHIADPDRRYFGIRLDAPIWLRDVWSFCVRPTDEEFTYFTDTMPQETARKLAGMRFDAVCTVEADGKKYANGLIFSAPRL